MHRHVSLGAEALLVKAAKRLRGGVYGGITRTWNNAGGKPRERADAVRAGFCHLDASSTAAHQAWGDPGDSRSNNKVKS